MQPKEETEILNIESLSTLAGSVTVVVAITNGLSYAFGWNARYLGLLVSFFISITSTIILDTLTGRTVLIAIFNTFIIYASSVGTASIISGSVGSSAQRLPSSKQKGESSVEEIGKRFWVNWY